MKPTIVKNLAKTLGAVGLAALIGTGSSALADSNEVSFEGKQVTVSIRSTPGGGYDFHGRLVARHLGKYLPGNPEVIAVNRPGGGGIVAANYLYNQAKKDGTDILIAARELALAERLGSAGIRYKTLEMPVLGSPVSDSRVLLTGPDSPVKNLADLKNLDRDFLFATSGMGAGSTQFIQLLEQAGYPVKIVTGYEGTSDQLLATLRGEVDGFSGTYPSQADLIEDENLGIVSKIGNHPDLAKTDDVRDALTGEFRSMANILATPLIAGRPFFTAPGTPEEVVAVLQDAFRKTVNDEDYLKELERSGDVVGYSAPDEIAVLYREIFDAPDHVVARFKE